MFMELFWEWIGGYRQEGFPGMWNPERETGVRIADQKTWDRMEIRE